MPSMICVSCLNQVSSACDIKKKCLEAEEKLKSLAIELIEETSFTPALQSSQDTAIIIQTVEEATLMNENLIDQDTADSFVNDEKEPIPTRSMTTRLSSNQTTASVVKNIQDTFANSVCELVSQHEKQFSCDICNFASKRKKNLQRHIFAVHLKSLKFFCQLDNCSRVYTTQAALKLHTVRDHDESTSPFKCDKCKQKFSCESLLKIHNQRLSCRPRKTKETKTTLIEKNLSCEKCSFKTAHQFSLKQHVELKHLNIRKTFECSYCDKVFSNRISFNHHTFTVHNMSHVRCEQCNQAFSSEEQLKSHKESLKCGSRLATDDDFVESDSGVKCTLCNRIYKSKKEWITHYFNHHKFKKVCNICNIQLSTYASLKNHKKTIHDKIKDFACTECPKKFAAKHTLLFHLNTHSGKKPYSCKFCSFKASDRSSVSKHQKKLHAG